jgi:hypothetical protein
MLLSQVAGEGSPLEDALEAALDYIDTFANTVRLIDSSLGMLPVYSGRRSLMTALDQVGQMANPAPPDTTISCPVM